MPAFTLDGKGVAGYAGFKEHCQFSHSHKVGTWETWNQDGSVATTTRF